MRFRAAYDWLGDRPLVAYFGTLGRVNGVEYLAELAASVADIDPEIRFLVVGGGGQESLVRERAARLGVLNRTFFMLPPLPKHEIPAILSAATIATSLVINRKELWANSANKVFDAFACGKPLAINYRGWQAMVLESSGAGIVLDPGAPGTAAWRLVAAVRNSAWLADAGRAAKDLGRREYSRDDLAWQLQRVLNDAYQEGPLRVRTGSRPS
jgi:glycosyltransferase involved in cell wall biosynthesis